MAAKPLIRVSRSVSVVRVRVYRPWYLAIARGPGENLRKTNKPIYLSHLILSSIISSYCLFIIPQFHVTELLRSARCKRVVCVDSFGAGAAWHLVSCASLIGPVCFMFYASLFSRNRPILSFVVHTTLTCSHVLCCVCDVFCVSCVCCCYVLIAQPLH